MGRLSEDQSVERGGHVATPEQPPRRRRPGAGRRRDPDIDARILHAARILYGADGWPGLNFNGVAKAAGVSKDAVYRRHRDRESLLLDALADQCVPAVPSGGPIEEAVVTYAVAIYDYVTSGDGYANLRIHLDGPRYPDVLAEYQRRVLAPSREHDVEILLRARNDGHLPQDTDCEAVITAVSGAVLLFALTQSAEGPRGRGHAVQIIRQTVRQIIHPG